LHKKLPQKSLRAQRRLTFYLSLGGFHLEVARYFHNNFASEADKAIRNNFRLMGKKTSGGSEACGWKNAPVTLTAKAFTTSLERRFFRVSTRFAHQLT
jgi:hypothetical protein